MSGLVDVLLFLGIALLILGAITVLSNLNNLARRRRILATPTSPVRQAMGGLVEIEGHIAPSDEGLVVAPFSGREVVWARVTVTHIKGGGQSGPSYSVVLSEVHSPPFFVDDDSGRVARGPSRRDPGPPVSDGTGLAPPSQLVMYADPGAHGELILTNKAKEQLASRLRRGFVLGLIYMGVAALAFVAGVLVP